MATKKKSAVAKRWKSIRVPESVHEQVMGFARSHRLGVADAYAVVVEAFSKLAPEEQLKEIPVKPEAA